MPRATKTTTRQRAEQVIKLQLHGASFPDVREYARREDPEAGTPWLGPNGKPLSDRQLWRIWRAADELYAERMEGDWEKEFARAILKRRLLYARALEAGDNRTALAAAQDESRLRGQYPEQQARAGRAGNVQVNVWGPVLARMSTEQLAELTALAESALNGVPHDLDSRGPLPVSGEAAPDPAGPAPGGNGAAGDVPPQFPDLCGPDVDPL
jgi:hypothetical protein